MPQMKTKTNVLDKYKGKFGKAFKKSKDKPAEVKSGGRLPGGIDGGVAQLASGKIGVFDSGDNKGQPYVMFGAVVKEPKKVGHATISGRQTFWGPEALCDTPKAKEGRPKTFEDHLDIVMNQMKLLGCDFDQYDADDPKTLQKAIDDLVEAAPYFEFSTSQSKPSKDYPNPRVWENWAGLVEDYEEGDTGGTEDETGESDEEAGEDESSEESSEEGSEDEEGGDEEGGDEEGGNEIDTEAIEALIAKATGKNTKAAAQAQKELEEMAEGLGVAEEFSTAEWDDVVELFTNASGGEEDSNEESSEEEAEESSEEGGDEDFPVVGYAYGYVPDPKVKDKKGKPKVVEVIIKDKDADKETATLRSDDLKKTWSKVAFSKIVEAPQ